MMFEEVHTYRHTWITQNNQDAVFCSIFLRNWTLEKVMIEIGVQFNLCKKSKSSGGEAAAPPMMFEEVLIQIGVQLLCKQSKQ